MGPGRRRSRASGIVQSLLITGVLVVAADARRPHRARRCSWAADSPALPIARHIQLLATWNFLLFGVTMVLFATVRANGAVWAPLIILAVGLVPVRFGCIFATYGWLGADAIWTSFPVTSLDQSRARGRLLSHGGWKKARMTVEERAVRRRMHRGGARDARAGRRAQPGWLTAAIAL